MIAINKEMFLVAMGEYGTQEWTGIEHNPEVMKYFHDIGHKWVKDDETAWCAAFVNWCALKSGYKGTGKLNARSFMDIGVKVYGNQGDIVVLWRINPDSPYGHVGLLVYKDEHFVWLLGGNQGNQINITKYPVGRVLGYRRLAKIMHG